jgi:hypothetical protein
MSLDGGPARPGREDIVPTRSQLAAQAIADLGDAERSRRDRIAEALGIAALDGIPWVGAIPAAIKAVRDEELQGVQRRIIAQWLTLHEDRLGLLARDLDWVVDRIEELGEQALRRAETPEFLQLVRKAFAGWDQADTDEKRSYYRRLLANHAAAPLTSDEVARLFIEWIGRYHEVHFRIISHVFNHRGCTKRSLGISLFGGRLPADASSAAGLFRELWRELNMGGIVRQARDIDHGSFLKKGRKPTRGTSGSPYVDTSFDDEDEQELSELGSEFVSYVLTDRIITLDTQSTASEA